jgi:hypothetical protein
MHSLHSLILMVFFFTSSHGFQPLFSFLADKKKPESLTTGVAKRSYWDKKRVKLVRNSTEAVANSNDEGRKITVETDYFVENRASENTTKKQSDSVPRQSKLPQRKSIKVYGDISRIDPITVTALLFAALAMNYILFAHWEDSGLSRLIARIINTV